jgi:hypothetical protein
MQVTDEMVEADKLIADYRAAYVAANGKDAPKIRHFNKWFIFEYEGAPIKYRKRAFETMRDRLRARLSSPPTREA